MLLTEAKRCWINQSGGAVIFQSGGEITIKTDDGDVIAVMLGTHNDALSIRDEYRANRTASRMKEERLESCGCCGHYHPIGWRGDCRDDGMRFVTPNDSDDCDELDDGSDDDDDKLFENSYECDDCDKQWTDTSPYMNDDTCPMCGVAYTPYQSNELD